MSDQRSWERYCRWLYNDEGLGLRVDVSRMNFDEAFLSRMAEPIARALAAMSALEGGAKANVDEDRMVGHYWLRAPRLAPAQQIGRSIEQSWASVKRFVRSVHDGQIAPQRGDSFYVALVIGIGGSALGPQFLCDALGGPDDPMIIRFLDNTDPDGIDRVLAELDEALEQTLVIVTSKSGSTIETRNGMAEVGAAYQRKGLDFARHAIAITQEGSTLHRRAVDERWLATFPMWDWVGGRTSVTSAVGLLPAALQGVDTEALLGGAREGDAATRAADPLKNPAALLALMWYYAGQGRGERNMIVLPYRDRLALLGRYLQQLVMESIGKARDRKGNEVSQGLTVFGNKGSTDQHSFVQQLRDGRNDFFVTFLDVLQQRAERSVEVEPALTAGDYLSGFLYGTREALHAAGRESITISLERFDARSLGALIALFERAVGLYAELIDVNAYDQPGVEAGKKAASGLLTMQKQILASLRSCAGEPRTAEQVANDVHSSGSVEDVLHLLEHLARSPDHGVSRVAVGGPKTWAYAARASGK